MFTDDFRSYIHNNFGISIVTQLERRDLGEDASFGGKLSDDEELKHQAVIIIHGITNKITRFNVGIIKDTSLKNCPFFSSKALFMEKALK